MNWFSIVSTLFLIAMTLILGKYGLLVEKSFDQAIKHLENK